MAPLVALALGMLSAAAGIEASHSSIVIRFDPRFELLSVVFRLAEFPEYSACAIDGYAAEVDEHFGPLQEHPAVQMARSLRGRIAYDAIPSLAIRVRDARRFEPLRALDDPSFGLDRRWDPGTAREFLKRMASFAQASRAEAFFRTHTPFYDGLVAAARGVFARELDLSWFDRKFGGLVRPEFTLVVAPLNGSGNYGLRLASPDKREHVFAFIGPIPARNGEPPSFQPGQLGSAVHEFLHSYVNPWAERHGQELDRAAVALRAPVSEKMRLQAYPTPGIVLVESAVRAFTIRYLRDHGRDDQAADEERRNEQLGFYWVRDLATLLDDHGRDNATFADFDTFTPRLVTVLGAWGAEADERYTRCEESRRARAQAIFAGGPRLVSVEPANGSQSVDPAATVIRFVFDRPMKRSSALFPTNAAFPAFDVAKKSWSADETELTLGIHLDPGTTYAFTLNDADFYPMQDVHGVPLPPTTIRFTTR
jgi:hypothetical protein